MKLGRKPRKFDQRIPHLSSLMAAVRHQLPAPPMEIDYTKKMPRNFGMMLNDYLGDCTCAALYHARQVWSFNASGGEITEPDKNVEQLYHEACGYVPGDASTDQGGVEQDVLKFLMNTGMPIGKVGERDKILAFIEVDCRNLDDLKRVIADCGVAYIGVEVPQSVMDNSDDTSKPWAHSNNDKVVGGHAVVLIGYDLDFFYCISWGQVYKITHNFLGYYLDEAYAIADPTWINATGKTPLGMTKEALIHVMKALKA